MEISDTCEEFNEEESRSRIETAKEQVREIYNFLIHAEVFVANSISCLGIYKKDADDSPSYRKLKAFGELRKAYREIEELGKYLREDDRSAFLDSIEARRHCWSVFDMYKVA